MDQAGEVADLHLAGHEHRNRRLTKVRITDELAGLGELACAPAAPAALEPDETLTCTATRTVTQDDLDFGSIPNRARSRRGAGWRPGRRHRRRHRHRRRQRGRSSSGPRLALTRPVDEDQGQAWRPGARCDLTVTNSSNVTLTGLAFVTDLDGSPVSRRAALAPGATAELHRQLSGDQGGRPARAGRRSRSRPGPSGPTARRPPPSDDVVAAPRRLPSRRGEAECAGRPGRNPARPSPTPAGSARGVRRRPRPDIGGTVLVTGAPDWLCVAAGAIAFAQAVVVAGLRPRRCARWAELVDQLEQIGLGPDQLGRLRHPSRAEDVDAGRRPHPTIGCDLHGVLDQLRRLRSAGPARRPARSRQAPRR